MTTRMKLSGFIRRLPNILTFATPVFTDDHGRTHAQSENRNTGSVDGFTPLDTSTDGFIQTEFPICVSLGDAALYAFEVSEHTIIAGTARALSEQLRQMLSEAPDYRSAMPRTSEMIDRFIDFATFTKTASTHSCLYHLGRVHSDEPRRLIGISSTNEYQKSDDMLENRAEAVEWLARLLGLDHEKQLIGHAETTLRVHDMIRASTDERRAAESIASAIRHISAASSMAAGRRVLGPNELCNTCFIELEKIFSTHGFLDDQMRPRLGRSKRMTADLPAITHTRAKAMTNFSVGALAKRIEEDVVKMQSMNKSFRSIIDRATRVDRR